MRTTRKLAGLTLAIAGACAFSMTTGSFVSSAEAYAAIESCTSNRQGACVPNPKCSACKVIKDVCQC